MCTGPRRNDPALMFRTLDPALRMLDSIDARAPFPSATMTMTAATPMIMPSAVSTVRMALRRSALSAIRIVIVRDMESP